jgi:Putative zinc-finger
MSHLGRWLSALVDGELDGAERDRVLIHLAGCASCRQEANTLRALKRRMSALGDTSADSAIAGRLIELGRSDQDLFAPAAPAWPAHWPELPADGSTWGRHQIRSGWMMAAGSAGVALAAIGAAAFMLGGVQPAPAPRVTPAFDTYSLQHDYDVGQAPAARLGSTGRASARPAVGTFAQPAVGTFAQPAVGTSVWPAVGTSARLSVDSSARPAVRKPSP